MMKKHAICKKEYIEYKLLVDNFYTLEINTALTMVYGNNIREKIMKTDEIDEYFDFILSKEEVIPILKDNLKIEDTDIIEYRDSSLDQYICFKYKHELIYLKFICKEFSIHIEITSNNLMRQKTFDILLLENDIVQFCNILKLMYK